MRPTPVLMIALLAAGCARQDDAPAAAQSEAVEPVTRVTQDGPVTATVTLAPPEPRLGDPLTLTLTVEAEAGVTVEMPAFGEALGRFSILDFTPRQRTGADGATVASQRYTLQAPMSGRQRIPPLRLEFLDERPGRDDASDTGEARYRELLTDEIDVQIASVLPEGEVIEQLRPPREELAELRANLLVRILPIVLGLVALAAAAAWGLAAWQRRARERVRITAYDRAMQRLGELERRGLPAAEGVDAWYVELSDIVRRYIEDQYGVRAPELTTEEFLQEARRSAELSVPHRDLLTAFLERCDRVKFAAYTPAQEESDEALALARRFLGETRIHAEHSPRLAA